MTKTALCKIAELITELPEAGGMSPRYRAYRWEKPAQPSVVIRESWYRREAWPGQTPEMIAYMESGILFYLALLHFDGMMLHASAVELEGKAYLFCGACGVGKSTHTRLWQSTFGESARVFNDDKPALRYLDGRWFVYGTPWCGKDGININMRAPLAGICVLKQGFENRIRRLSSQEAIAPLLAQTLHKLYPAEMDLLLGHLEKIVQEIPIFELENRPEPAAAWLSYETMRRAAEEKGL